MPGKEYSLREKKHARTKLAIVNAFVQRLRASRYDGISIRELCRSVEISEGTFFNYFPEKIDLINYYITLLLLKIIWKARREAPPGRSLALIDEVFVTLAGDLHSANLGYQLISIMVNQQERPEPVDITPIEKQLAFPRCAGIEEIPTMPIGVFFKGCLKDARAHGELPADVAIDDIVISLLAIMGGTLLAAKLENIRDKAYHYTRQLRLLWKGLGVRSRRR